MPIDLVLSAVPKSTSWPKATGANRTLSKIQATGFPSAGLRSVLAALLLIAVLVAPSTAQAQMSTAPTVSTSAITSDPGTDNLYITLDVITVSVTFGEAVTVTGTPQVTLDIGGTDRTANYSGEGSATGQLLFSYVVVAADADDDGITLKANSLALNGGTIQAMDDDTDATLAHSAMTFTNHNVNTALVSNAGQTAGDDVTTADGRAVFAQAFITGDYPHGYFLSSVEVGLEAATGVTAKVELFRTARLALRPDHIAVPLSEPDLPAVHATLRPVGDIDDDTSTLERFSAHDVLLLPNEIYWIVVTRTAGADSGLSVATTNAGDAVDSGGLTGFSFRNNIYTRDSDAVTTANREGWIDYDGSGGTGMKLRLRGSQAERPPGPYSTNRNKQPRDASAETSASATRYATSFRTSVPFLSGITSYELTAVSLGVAAEAGVSPRVAIHADDSGSPADSALTNGTLTAPDRVSRDLDAPEKAEFTASAPITLATNTTYWVVLDKASGTGNLSVSTTRRNAEDRLHTGKLSNSPAWTIRDTMRAYNGTSWPNDPDERSFRMALHGTTDPHAGEMELGLPQVGVGLTPQLEDFSLRIDNESWQWSRGETSDGTFTDIPASEGGTARMYVPSDADLGMWLRATVNYDDGFGPGKSATRTSLQTVLSRPAVSNAGQTGAISFALQAGSGSVQLAQAFTTGAGTAGSLLTGLRVPLEVDPDEANWISWTLHEDDGGEPAATPLFEEIRFPADILDEDTETFEESTHPGFLLEPETTYWVVLKSNPLPEVTVRFEEESYTVDEDGSVDIAVILSADPDRTMEFPITTVNRGSTGASDYSHTPESVTFEAGQTRQTVTFTPFDDDEDDGGESVMLVFGEMPDIRVNPWPADGAIVSIVDNDHPEVTASFAAATYTVAEGGTAEVTVTLSADPERTVTVPITTTNQGTTTSSDYSGVPSGVTFNSGETSKSFTFTAETDSATESDESVLVGFGATLPDGVTEGTQATTTVTIAATSVSATFGSATYSATEGSGTVVTVQLSAAASGTVTIPVSVVNLGGASDSDYSGVPENVAFSSGESAKTFTFTATEDHLVETGEQVKLAIGPLPSGIAAGTSTETTVSISDDTGTVPPTVHFAASTYSVDEGGSVVVTVTLNKAPGSDAVIPITTTDQDGAGPFDYSGVPDSVTFGAADTSKTITFAATEDPVDDDGESVVLRFGILSGGITATMDQPATATVSITDDDDFAPDGSLIESLPISEWGEQRMLDGPPKLDPGGKPGWTLDYSVLSDNRGPGGGGWDYWTTDLELSGKSVMRISIVARDLVETEVSFAEATYEVDEGGTVEVTVNLSADPEATIEIPITVTNQGDTDNSDYSGVPASVTFQSTETTKTFTFTAEPDMLDEDDDSVLLGFGTRLPLGVSVGTTAETTVTIIDDDNPQVTVSYERSSYSVAEGENVTIAVVLSADPARTVVIPLTKMNQGDTIDDDYSGVPASLTFNAGQTRQTFVFTAEEDMDEDPGESVLLGFENLPTGVSAGANDQTTVTISGCQGGGIWCDTMEFRADNDYPAGRKGLVSDRGTFANQQFTYNEVNYEVVKLTLHPQPSGIVQPSLPYNIPDRATLLVLIANRSAEDRADLYTLPNEDYKNWTLYVSTQVDGETLEAMLPLSDAKFCCDHKFRYYGLDLDQLNAAWETGKVYQLRIVEDVLSDRPTAVPGPPLYVEASQGRSRIFVSWLRPQTRNDDPPTGVTYKIQWKLASGSWDTPTDVSETVHEPRSTSRVHMGRYITGLTPGTRYDVRVIATNAGGDSDPSDVVTFTTESAFAQHQGEGGPNSPATGSPGITGTALPGETLTATTTGIADEDGMENPAFTFQWVRQDLATFIDEDIEGATGPTYLVTAQDQGKALKVRVSFTDDAGNEESLTSYAVIAAPPITLRSAQGVNEQQANRPAAGAPQITGIARVGETLIADPSGIADQDGMNKAEFSYQWIRHDLTSDTDAFIAGAVSSTYAVAETDVGKAISVRISFTDDAGNPESLASTATAAVERPPLTAEVEDVPDSHDGLSVFTFKLVFSEAPRGGFSYKTLRDHALTVTGGQVTRAKRGDPPGNVEWQISVRPHGDGAVTIVLPETTDCDDEGAICTADGGKLSNRLEITVQGPDG